MWALALATAGCVSHAPQIGAIGHIEAFCAPREARPTSMASIVTTMADRIDDPFPRLSAIRRELKATQGAIGYWEDQPILEPKLAKTFGESGDYIRIDAIAIPTAPERDPNDTTIPQRRVYVLVKDHDIERWIGMTAYDTQNVCVESTRQN